MADWSYVFHADGGHRRSATPTTTNLNKVTIRLHLAWLSKARTYHKKCGQNSVSFFWNFVASFILAQRLHGLQSTLWRLIGDRVEDSEIATSDHKLIEFGLKINIRGQRRQQYIKNHLKRQDGGDIWRCRATTPKLEKCYTLFKTERACVTVSL